MKNIVKTKKLIAFAILAFCTGTSFADGPTCSWINMDSDNWDNTFLNQNSCLEMFKACGSPALTDEKLLNAGLEIHKDQVTAITTSPKPSEAMIAWNSIAKFDKKQFDALSFQNQKDKFISQSLGAMCASVKKFTAALSGDLGQGASK